VSKSILLIGESDVGKTHYGGQLLKRLMRGDGQLRMNGAATNLQPFETVMESLNDGRSAEHTPTSTYVDSVWPVIERDGRTADLVWPDYGGEQIKTMLSSRHVSKVWQSRIANSPAWLLLIRLQKLRVNDDIFSRPLSELGNPHETQQELQVSDQARLIELLQMLIYTSKATNDRPISEPRINVLLTCWDELSIDIQPILALKRHLPLFTDFLLGNWAAPAVLGLSALGRALKAHERDSEYAARGPEMYGYVVLEDGTQSPDLTLPIKMLM
jgi:Double-GTPase 1